MRHTLVVVFLISLPALGTVENGFPSVAYRGGVLVASPAPDHKAENPSVEILESEECQAASASRNSLRVSGRCEFLRAMYSYYHQEPKTGQKLRTLIGFTFSSAGAGHSLIVSGPVQGAKPN